MRKLVVLFFMLFSTFVFAKKTEVSVSSKEVVLGGNFSLTIKFEHNGDTEPYVSFDPKNAEVIDDNSSDGTRMQIRGSYRGGKLIQKKIYIYRYVLQPVSQGSVFIRNIKIDLGNDVIKLPTQKVRVLLKAKRIGNYTLRAEVSNETPYVGEGVDLNYYLYFKGDITQPDVRKFPKLKGFLKRFELPRSGVERVSLNGDIYKRLLIYKARLYPEEAKKLVIDPLEISFQYPDRKNMRRDIFGMSMTFSSGSYKTKKERSKRLKIDVQPLPIEGMPKNFTGLVGDHNFSISFTRSKIVVNDILEARLEVTGSGALEKLDPPKIINSENFEEFDPKTEIIKLQNLEHKKVIDYTYLAKRSSKYPAANLKLSIFDPVKRQYIQKEIAIPEIQIFGSGIKTQTIGKEIEKKQDVVTQEGSENRLELVAPIFKTGEPKERLLNINLVNIVIFVFIVLVLISSMPGISTFIPQRNMNIGKNLDYASLHDFIIDNQDDGVTVREKIETSSISKEAKKYFIELLEKAENNAYKGKSHKLKYEKKYFVEFKKAGQNESV